MKVKVWLDPQFTTTAPDGEIVPLPLLAVAVMVKVLRTKLAAMVWFAVTLLKVKLVTAPTDDPSTSTSWTL